MFEKYANAGNFVRGDGSRINLADYLSTQSYFCPKCQTLHGNASILSIRLEALEPTTPHYFTINIPPEKRLILQERHLTLSAGRYFIDAIAVESIDLTGSDMGVKAPLNKVDGTVVQTTLEHTTNGVTSPVVREYGFVDTGEGLGHTRVQGTTGSEGIYKILQGPSILRIQKTDAGVFTCNLVYVVWEE